MRFSAGYARPSRTAFELLNMVWLFLQQPTDPPGTYPLFAGARSGATVKHSSFRLWCLESG